MVMMKNFKGWGRRSWMIKTTVPWFLILIKLILMEMAWEMPVKMTVTRIRFLMMINFR